ncbi:hypothetical protein [Metabacillus niabensis]|uniref:hypothetical protein n=1 Tax=Metabacillus niabensis TaxID=324854 RepID=UPI001CF9E6B1|nr:hypothetical protein [Metabacillus niabensis]
MKCKECQSALLLTPESNYCEECTVEFFKFSLFKSIESWGETLFKDDFLFYRSEIYLREQFNGMEYTVENINRLIEDIKRIIKAHLSFYTREDVIMVMLMHRQYFRAAIDSGDKEYWLWMNEYGITNLLIELVYEIDNDDFLGAFIGELEAGYCNLVTAISLSRILINLENVLDSIFKDRQEKLDISEILERQKQDEIVDTYYEKSRFDSSIEKPENYVIKNKNLLSKLEEMNLDLLSMEEKVEEFLKEKYGITSEEIRSVVAMPFRLKSLFDEYTFEYQSLQLIMISKEKLYEIIKCELGLDRTKFEKIIDLFSLQNLSIQQSINNRIIYELKSIIRVNGLVIFGPYDLIQNYGVFKALHHSSHFPYFFIKDYQNNMSLMNTEMDEITKHMTSYFVASVVDVLMNHGYRLPSEKKKYNGKNIFVPRFEINKIINGNKNILANKGDIDVIALDEKRKIIFNIEVKYYQPAISLKEMRFKDEKKISKKNTIEKIKNRHEVIELNKNLVLDLFDIQDESDEYTVKSLIVTARENFFLTSNDYPYYNWNEFNRVAEANEL